MALHDEDGGLAAAPCQLRIPDELQNRGRRRSRVTRLDEQAGALVLDRVRNAAGPRAHDRQPVRSRLLEDDSEALPPSPGEVVPGKQREQRRRRIRLRERAFGQPSGKEGVAVQAESLDLPLELSALRALAYDRAGQVGRLAPRQGNGLQQQIVPLPRDEPADADDERPLSQPEALAQSWALGGLSVFVPR